MPFFERSAEARLSAWIKEPRRKPLVIRGARQVGKSTLVRAFAERHGLTLHEVNLERQRALAAAFETMNLPRIVRDIEFVVGRGALVRPGGLLFLDELQAAPAAIQALRYFREEYPAVPVVAAGSLLEFALSQGTFSMPVGRVEYLYLGPLSFSEFLRAMGEAALATLLASWSPEEPLPASAHERLLELQRVFLLLGGMPEAVQTYVDTHSLSAVSDVHASVMETYRDDFAKYASAAQLSLLRQVFDAVTLSVGTKVKYARVAPEARAREVAPLFELLEKAQVLHLAFHTDATGIPLRATLDRRVFKPYLLDVGLLAHATGLRRLDMDHLRARSFVNEGPLAEQFVAQHLAYLGARNEHPALAYWLREGRSACAEVDFVVGCGATVVPIEVKAGASGTLRSLQQFVAQRRAPLAVRLDLNPPSMQVVRCQVARGPVTGEVNYRLLSLPLYLVEHAGRAVDALGTDG